MALKIYKLQSFQGRIFLKLAYFGFQMEHLPHAPAELKNQPSASPAHNSYQLRSVTRNCLRAENVSSAYGNGQFKNFYAKLLNHHFELNELFVNQTFDTVKIFKLFLCTNYGKFLSKFLSIFNIFTFSRLILLNMEKSKTNFFL